MNYITEINAFEYRMRRDPLPQAAQLLWYKLMHFSNRLHWPEWFAIDNSRLMALLNITGEITLRTARQPLEEKGYIQFERGTKGHPSRYRIIPAAERDAAVTNSTDTAEPDEAEYIEGDFLADIAEDIRSYFGFCSESQREIKRTTARLYETYLPNVKPTQQDEARVFHYIKEQREGVDGQWTMSFPEEKKELLGYAFEQASMAGSVNWNYIGGIYRNLTQRGITTREQAYDYDFERDQRTGRR